MPRRLRWQIKVAELRRVFRSDQNQLVDAHIARLCVLYEDLRIELKAVSAPSIPLLDVLDPSDAGTEPHSVGAYRRHYFLRRSVCTLFEFAEGLRLLGECSEFEPIMAGADTPIVSLWDKSVEFFRSRERFIQDVRNDVGGHFGSKAAIYAVPNIDPKAIGKIELRYDDDQRCEPRLHFVASIAGVAFLKHLEGATVKEKTEGFIRNVLLAGYHHATNSVQVLVVLHLWPRFGR